MAESSQDLQILMVLQRRHLCDQPLEYLVKCRPLHGRMKEIWMTRSTLVRTTGGRKLVKEFNNTKVGERGVDVYLEKRRSLGRKSLLLSGEVLTTTASYGVQSAALPNDAETSTSTDSAVATNGRRIGAGADAAVERSSTTSSVIGDVTKERSKARSSSSSSGGARRQKCQNPDPSARNCDGDSKRKTKSSSSRVRHSSPSFSSNRKSVKRPKIAHQDVPSAAESSKRLSSKQSSSISSLNFCAKDEFSCTGTGVAVGSDDRSGRSSSSSSIPERDSSNNNNNKNGLKIALSHGAKQKQEDSVVVGACGTKKRRTTDVLYDTDPDSEVNFKISSDANSTSDVCAKLVVKNLKPGTNRKADAGRAFCRQTSFGGRSTSSLSSKSNQHSSFLNGLNSMASRQHGTSLSSSAMTRPKTKRKIDVDALAEDEIQVERRISVRQTESAFKFKEIVVRKCPGYMHLVTLSQKEAKNTFSPKVFQELTIALHNAVNDDCHVVLLSASGNVFSSGIDVQYLLNAEEDRYAAARNMADSLRDFINCLISFPKPIVVAVNGPAVGLGMAILPLCDVIYASDKASFSCPYTALCQTPEGCSSYTFQKMMGTAMANELLLRGRKITALEAHQIGLISQVFWPDKLMSEVTPRVQNLAAQSLKALECTKMLIRAGRRQKLERVNEAECRMLQERWTSGECQRAMQTYLEQATDDLA